MSGTDIDRAHMRAALALARRSLGATWPNPAVGCILVKDGVTLGRGWTQPGGRPHGETEALRDAARRWGEGAARGATAYVTLEPCAHFGRTPPCADALLEAGVARVVSTLLDSDPRVSGRGFSRLREAGVEVVTDVEAEAARALNRGFLLRHERGRPLLTLKLAASLDGRIATASGESRWITGPAARGRVHLMRAESDAVLVGSGTARADDPSLDVRLPSFSDRRPVRIVADGGLSLPLDGRLARTARAQPLWLLHRPGVEPRAVALLEAEGARLVEVPVEEGGALDLTAALERLATLGLTRVFCEGGGRLAAGLLRADLVDEIAWFQAGAALGADGRPALGPLGLEALSEAPRFRLRSVEQLGDDLLSLWSRAGEP